MAKKSENKDPEEKARSKLAQAEMKLHAAQDKHMQARARGKQEVEQAHLRAAKWLAKTAEQVERRTAQVARAEARLLALINQSPEESGVAPESPAPVSGELEGVDGWWLSSEPLLDEPIERGFPLDEEPQLDQPEADASGGLRERELRALQVLRRLSREGGVAVGEWRAGAEMPETTFARARKALMVLGFVESDGTPGRTTRYTLTDEGEQALT